MCITLIDGSIVLLPGIESSIINLKKVLKAKREEINKQAERRNAINSSISQSTNPMLIIPTQNVSPTFHPSTHTSSPSYAAELPDSLNVSSSDSRTACEPPTDETKNTITRTIIDWLNKNKDELNLVNTNFTEAIHFRFQLNKRQDGIMMICKCGKNNSIAQKQGILVFSNIYRHLKSGKCSLITENKQNLIDNDATSNNEDGQTQSSISISRQSNSTSATTAPSKNKKRTRSISNVSKKKKKQSN